MATNYNLCEIISLSDVTLQPTVPAEGKKAPKIGNIGHLTRISNKLVQLGNNNDQVKAYLQVTATTSFPLLNHFSTL